VVYCIALLKIYILIIKMNPNKYIIHNDYIAAYEYFDKKKQDVCNTGSIDIKYLFSYRCDRSPQIGADGNLVEFRPDPSEFPLEHVESIEKLIHVLDNHKPKNYVLKAGTVFWYPNGGYESMGGHIHIGIDKIKSKKHLAQYLSYYCGIPLRKIEHPMDLTKRGCELSRYGYYGSYTEKSYGIEWRMPASWLINKEIAKAALCLAYVVAKQSLIDRTSNVLIDHDQYIKILNSNIEPILKYIESMEYYKYYRPEIDPLLTMIREGKTWEITDNLIKHW